MTTLSRSFRQIYGPAMVVAAITTCGLLFALLGDGWWDATSWVLLASPLLLLAFYLFRPSVRTR